MRQCIGKSGTTPHGAGEGLLSARDLCIHKMGLPSNARIVTSSQTADQQLAFEDHFRRQMIMQRKK
jgi:hypothetical protein